MQDQSHRELDPDHAEQDAAGFIDDAVPSKGYQLLPVVGIGGSAGSISALETMFRAMPGGTGMAFVVVLHLAPDQDSALPELLASFTSMPVVRVGEPMRLEPDTVYVIPPRYALRTLDGNIQLAELPRQRHRHVAVDLFFRTLADTHGPHAIAIVLSGMDGDGAIGIKRIKERGGLTIAQEPQEAAHTGMPRAAIGTGMVDWVLPVAEMPLRLVEYMSREKHLKLPPEAAGLPPLSREADSADEAALRDILSFLRTRTSRDFGSYKRATILRRIGRRMQVNGIYELPAYLGVLRTRPGEAGALLQDLLISVTNFFRDAECFAALEQQLPRLFQEKSRGGSLRIWIPACATGEEAYSIAMLLSEQTRARDVGPQIQVFASDLDEDAIAVARDGFYPASIEADVSEERLQRFFIREHRGYRVRREIREMVLFAVHDVLRDSPFSRLDLISCRNLLIYLNRDAQLRVFRTFQFALNPGRLLFLGSSESVEDGNSAFKVLDKKHRVYEVRAVPRLPAPLPLVSPVDIGWEAQKVARPAPVVAGRAFDQAGVVLPPNATPPELDGRAVSWGELHFRLLEYLAPPSVLLDSEHDIVHLSPGAGRFLQFGGGEPSRNLLRMIHPSLRIELRAALYQAAQSGHAIDLPPLSAELTGEATTVSIRVRPVGDIAPDMTLVTLQARAPSASETQAETAAPRLDVEPVAHRLDRELERLKAHLRDTVEQYEASNEELKASNEELQAMNEELRSATEELETSREELQSINEELTTVNQELKSKVDELGHANSDMHNLMDATAIATVFLDRDLRITRYTPSAVTLFNLIPTDVGRPLSDLTMQLDYPELGADARRVLDKLVPVEREVGGSNGNGYLVRALPYRTLDDRIAGVVLAFVDVSERKASQEALRRSEERFSTIVNQAAIGVLQADLDGRITFANRHFCALLGYAEDELVGMPKLDLIDETDRLVAQVAWLQLVTSGDSFEIEQRARRRDGSTVWLHTSASLLHDGAGKPLSTLFACSDIADRRRAEAALRESEERLRMIVENAVEYAIFTTDLHGRVTSWNSGAERLLGYREEEVSGHTLDRIFTDEDRAAGAPELELEAARTEGRAGDDRLHRRKDGSVFWSNGVTMPMRDAQGVAIGFVKILRDQTGARENQQALERSRAELLHALQAKEDAHAALEAADSAKDRFLAVLSHELRNPLSSILGASESLQTGELKAPERRRASEIVRRQAQTMRVLLDDLLDISRLRLGRLALQRSQVTLAQIVDAAVDAAGPEILAARHNLTIVMPEADATFSVDAVRMSQVLSNLLSNSAKYTPDSGEIELSATIDGDEVVFVVRDNGIGMEAAELDTMFDLYAQGRKSSKRPSGLGIGLALVRNLVEQHGGSVGGSSDGPGRGSTFVVRIPRGEDEAPVAWAPDPARDGASPRWVDRPVHVLMADDNVDALWALSKLLEAAGHRVTTADGGQQALDLAERDQPDVLVLDLGMPGVSGFDVARAVRAAPWGADILLIAASGWGREHDQMLTAEAGFDAHLVKPTDVGALNQCIAERIRQRES